jgi:hypothetical protein
MAMWTTKARQAHLLKLTSGETSPNITRWRAKQADLVQWLIVDFADTEPILRDIASEEKSAIE